MAVAELQPPEKITLSPAAPAPNPLGRLHLQDRSGDRIFRYLMLGFSSVVIFLALGMLWKLIASSRLAWHAFGFKFLATSTWDPVGEVFGALPFIYGTLVSSALALA